MTKYQRPKGTQDITPEDIATWQFLEQVTRTVFNNAHFQEVRTPILEHLDLFERGVGEDTDIVNKEMYAFEKGDRMLCLRPENTAGVVRAYVENGMTRWPKPVKLWYMGPMFRYERPQAGRQRQFHQIGIELLGLDTPESDAEVIMTAVSLLSQLGITGLSLEINSLGDESTRPELLKQLRALIQPELPLLCEDCQKRFETNVLRMLDCKHSACQNIYNHMDIPSLFKSITLGSSHGPDFQKLLSLLDALNIQYRHNPMLVRGLDYYSHTVFEITSNQLGAQNAVCGGGRYNKLVNTLGGPDTPAIGWAMGVERLLAHMTPQTEKPLDFYIISDNSSQALIRGQNLRNEGYTVEINLTGKPLAKQLSQLGKIKAKSILIIENGQESTKVY